MSDGHPIDAYLKLADDLFTGNVAEVDFPAGTAVLPLLDKNLLDQLAIHSEGFSTTKPRLSWAISFIAYHAAVTQNRELFLQSLAAWHLARSCNHWAQPKRVKEAISIARYGFEELKETGWLSACDWQENALAWARPNFSEAARSLKEALAGLEHARFTDFIPDCRLALAYAQILIGEHEAALDNIGLSEKYYNVHGRSIDQARCWLNQASSLRRQDRFEQARQKLEAALLVFERENAITDQAKARFQMALGHLLKVDDLSEAVLQFTKAADLFETVDLDLWRAMCVNNLGSVYLFTGELALANKYYQEAGEVFRHHEISGLLADNLNDHGEVNILRGRPQASIGQFKQALALNEKLGSQLSAAVAATNLGKAFGQNGRYQDALFYIELATDRLESLKSYLRLGTCEKYAALIWSQLGQPALTHEQLDHAILHYELADQRAMLSEIHNIRATAFFQQGRDDEAIASLKESLDVSLAYGVKPQVVLARRLLGEALAQIGKYKEALRYLNQAQADSSEMGMQMETAASLVAIGICHASTSRQADAWIAYQQALQLSKRVLPEIEWRALVGLGNLAKSQSDAEQALKTYRQAVNAFARIRQNFWQPGLAGSYLLKPSRVFDRIIFSAARVQSAGDALSFIEDSKASTLFGQLLSGDPSRKKLGTQELNDMESEIIFLQDQLRTSMEMPLPLRDGSAYRQIRARLNEKTEQYDALKSRLERRSSPSRPFEPVEYGRFDLSDFRDLANGILHRNWIALDYYVAEDQLITLILGPDRCDVLSVPIPHRFRMALDACKKAGQNAEPPTQGDLDSLGKLLIPPRLAKQMTPETLLIISPHKELHSVPWAALRPDSSAQPLAKICIPTVAPSLQNLMAIWRRQESRITLGNENGLVIGLSSFNGRRRDLPHIKNEISFLSSRLGSRGVCLAETEAVWENVLKLSRTNEGLSRFAWLHVASHFFSNAQTGRLSGLALWDGDVWLDQLRDLSPLPDLLTLSACNSISSFVYEGDEHTDVPSACLAAGANSVVGNLWPVLDRAAAEFTSIFYGYYLEGRSPAEAVAHAQRGLMDRGEPASQWASFACIGAP